MSLCQMMKPQMVKEETWWTFLDFAKEFMKTDSVLNEEHVFNPITSYGTFGFISITQSFAPNGFGRINQWITGISYSTYYTFEEYFMALLLNRFANHYCIKAESLRTEESPARPTDEVKEFYNMLTNIWVFTKDKYLYLIQAYQNEEANLLNKVQTLASGTTRYNDTPQDSGDFSDDSHTTNISQTSGESSTDVKPLIERLSDISRLYQQVLLDWTEEFERLFIEEGNIQ